jgi:hypothetical protein
VLQAISEDGEGAPPFAFDDDPTPVARVRRAFRWLAGDTRPEPEAPATQPPAPATPEPVVVPELGPVDIAEAAADPEPSTTSWSEAVVVTSESEVEAAAEPTPAAEPVSVEPVVGVPDAVPTAAALPVVSDPVLDSPAAAAPANAEPVVAASTPLEPAAVESAGTDTGTVNPPSVTPGAPRWSRAANPVASREDYVFPEREVLTPPQTGFAYAPSAEYSAWSAANDSRAAAQEDRDGEAARKRRLFRRNAEEAPTGAALPESVVGSDTVDGSSAVVAVPTTQLPEPDGQSVEPEPLLSSSVAPAAPPLASEEVRVEEPHRRRMFRRGHAEDEQGPTPDQDVTTQTDDAATTLEPPAQAEPSRTVLPPMAPPLTQLNDALRLSDRLAEVERRAEELAQRLAESARAAEERYASLFSSEPATSAPAASAPPLADVAEPDAAEPEVVEEPAVEAEPTLAAEPGPAAELTSTAEELEPFKPWNPPPSTPLSAAPTTAPPAVVPPPEPEPDAGANAQGEPEPDSPENQVGIDTSRRSTNLRPTCLRPSLTQCSFPTRRQWISTTPESRTSTVRSFGLAISLLSLRPARRSPSQRPPSMPALPPRSEWGVVRHARRRRRPQRSVSHGMLQLLLSHVRRRRSLARRPTSIHRTRPAAGFAAQSGGC